MAMSPATRRPFRPQTGRWSRSHGCRSWAWSSSRPRACGQLVTWEIEQASRLGHGSEVEALGASLGSKIHTHPRTASPQVGVDARGAWISTAHDVGQWPLSSNAWPSPCATPGTSPWLPFAAHGDGAFGLAADVARPRPVLNQASHSSKERRTLLVDVGGLRTCPVHLEQLPTFTGLKCFR